MIFVPDNSSNKENIAPSNDDDKSFDFENSSFKYDNEYSTDESYEYSSEDDVKFNIDKDNNIDFSKCRSEELNSDGSNSVFIGTYNVNNLNIYMYDSYHN